MLLESFKASSDAGYVVIPRMRTRTGYVLYDYSGLTPEERLAWRNAITIPEVRRVHPETPDAYMKILQELGIRCAIAATEACHVLRSEFNSIPICRRIK